MSKQASSFPLVHPNAAGIDVGSRSHWVCVGEGEDTIREFGVFTQDLHDLSAYLRQHGVKSVAMESTGFYWKNLFMLLQEDGLEVFLVNAGHVRNARGKKSDVQDCQWIWQLHSFGLLHASFQPDPFTEELRTYSRHRKKLVEGASQWVSKMQKALIMMNLQLPVVLSDITGKSGQDIIKAILQGERDGRKLAGLASPRCKADTETLTKALSGHWSDKHLFELRQCLDMYHFHQQQISQCETSIENLLEKQVTDSGQIELAYEPEKKRKSTKTPLRHPLRSIPTS